MVGEKGGVSGAMHKVVRWETDDTKETFWQRCHVGGTLTPVRPCDCQANRPWSPLQQLVVPEDMIALLRVPTPFCGTAMIISMRCYVQCRVCERVTARILRAWCRVLCVYVLCVCVVLSLSLSRVLCVCVCLSFRLFTPLGTILVLKTMKYFPHVFLVYCCN